MFVNVVVGRLQKNHSILSLIKMIVDFLEDLMNGQMYFDGTINCIQTVVNVIIV